MKIILHNKPTIGKEEIEASRRVLVSGWLAEGKEVKRFEDEFSKYLGYGEGHAAAVSSGTSALYLALICLGVKANDEVITSTYVCSAILNAIFMAGAKPVLVDINPDDFNVSFEKTKKRVTSKTKAIIVPHIFGMPADIDKFMRLSVPVIEDCAQAIGSKLDGKLVGTFGQAAIFSFYASKVITTGYGGLIFSKDKNFIEKAKDYREFDCRRDYRPRFNFQMSDLQAAIGSAQLKKLPQFLKRRKEIASGYQKMLPQNSFWPPVSQKGRKPNFYRFLVKTKTPKKIIDKLAKNGIKSIVPIETFELLHRYLKQKAADFPVSEKIAKTTLSLPVYPSLNISEAEKIGRFVSDFIKLK